MRLRYIAWDPVLLATAAAVLAFNNWALGIFLNMHLVRAGGSVSELGALNQPHHYIFESLDVISGLLFALVAVLLVQKIARTKLNLALVITTASLGLANALDGLFRLPCAVTVDSSCSVPVNVSLSHFAIPSHAYTSVVIGTCYLVLPLLGVVYARRISSRRFLMASKLTLLAVAVSTASVVINYLVNHGPSTRAWGPSQVSEMLVFSAWFVFWVLTAHTKSFANK